MADAKILATIDRTDTEQLQISVSEYKGKNIEYILLVQPNNANSVSVVQIENLVKEFVKLNSLNELK